MRALGSQDCASYKGRFISFDKVFCRPLPQERRIPIIVGGDTVAAARRAGRLGDGYFPARNPPPETFQEMRRAAEAAGRDPASIEITLAAPAEPAEIEALAKQGVTRVAVPISAAAGLPAQLKTPDDVLRYGKDMIARFWWGAAWPHTPKRSRPRPAWRSSTRIVPLMGGPDIPTPPTLERPHAVALLDARYVPGSSQSARRDPMPSKPKQVGGLVPAPRRIASTARYIDGQARGT